MKTVFIRILVGLLVSTASMALLFYFFLFANPIGIHQSNNLKWVPILIVSISFYLSGRINKKTHTKWLPILLLPIELLQQFNYLYFPFIAIALCVAALMIIASRQKPKYSYLASGVTLVTFLFFLFNQPLILEKQNFGYGHNGELVNANTLWDFSSNEEKQLPHHDLYDINGRQLNLSSLKGKSYFLTFWATWCAPCIEQKPELEKLKNEYENDHEIEFIDISFDTNKQLWEQYIQEHKPSGLQLLSDDHQLTSRKLDFMGLPMYIIVDKHGSYNPYPSLKVAKDLILKI